MSTQVDGKLSAERIISEPQIDDGQIRLVLISKSDALSHSSGNAANSVAAPY